MPPLLGAVVDQLMPVALLDAADQFMPVALLDDLTKTQFED